MLGIDSRAARAAWTTAFVVLALWLIYLLRSTLFVFVLAVLLAYLLAPLVDLLNRLFPGKRTRLPALVLAYLLVVGLVVTAGILIGSRVVEQGTELAQRFPAMLQHWESYIHDKVPDSLRVQLTGRSNDLVASLPVFGLRLLGLMGNLIYLVIIPVLAFLCLKDGEEMRRHFLGLAPPGESRALLDDVLADIHVMLAQYMRALVLQAVVAFTAYSVFLSVLSIPYAILLAVLAGALEFIPMVGPLAAGAVVLAIAGASGGHVLAILIFIVAFRMFQDYLVSPHLMQHGVQLHPLLVLFGVFAGAELAGVPGTFLSVPVLALARVLYLRIYRSRQVVSAGSF